MCQSVAEIAGALIGCRHGGNVAQSLTNPGCLVVAEDECLVFLDGSSKKSTKLISLKGRLRRRWRGGEIVSRVQYVVADKFKQPAVKLICAGFYHHVHRSPTAAKFRAHGVFFGTEFLNCVRWRKHHDTAEAEFIVVHTVQQEVVVRDAEPIDRERFVGPLVLENSAGNVGPSRAAIGTWSQIGKLNEIATV